MKQLIANRASSKPKPKRVRSKSKQAGLVRSSSKPVKVARKSEIAKRVQHFTVRRGKILRRAPRRPAVVGTTQIVSLPGPALSRVKPHVRSPLAHPVEMEDWVEAVRQAHILHDNTVPKLTAIDEAPTVSSKESAAKLLAPPADTIIAGTPPPLPVVTNQVAQVRTSALSSTPTVSPHDNRKAAGNDQSSKTTVLLISGAETSQNRVGRIIMFVLGIFWVIDGLLQFQPASFTQTFVDSVLAPNLQGQPAGIPNLLNLGIGLFSSHVFGANLVAAVTQVFIGALLVLRLKRPFKVFALYFSIAWSVMVWIFGEGLGNVLTGGASFYTGAPGSVLLYLILAVFLLFPKKLPVAKLPFVAGALFLFGAFLQVSPTFWSTNGVQSVFQFASSDSLSFIAAPAKSVATFASSLPALSNLLLVVVLVVFGGFLLFGPSREVAGSVAVFLGLVWWFGQDFGGVQTFPMSTATDPNSAPIFMLFLIPAFAGLRAGLPKNIVGMSMMPANSFGNPSPAGGRSAVARSDRVTSVNRTLVGSRVGPRARQRKIIR